MSQNLVFLDQLTPTQEHFLKKFLVEACLRLELQYLLKPHCLEYIGPPFRSNVKTSEVELPLLRYFFSHFVALFPFITMNAKTDQVQFWRDTVQPFVESFNTKRVSNASQRKENTTKRHQVNRQLLRTLLLFYNSMLSLKQEIEYLTTDHLKPSDQGKLDKISKTPAMVKVGLGAFHAPSRIDDYSKMVYTNNYNINIVAVDVFLKKAPQETSSWSLNPLRLMGPAKKALSSRRCVFILQVTKRTMEAGQYQYDSHFILQTYADFKLLELALKSSFPGLMSTEIHAIPSKFKHDLGVRDSGPSPIVKEGPGSPASESTNDASLGENFSSITLDSFSSDDSDTDAEEDPLRDHSHKYYNEKLRLALRGYVNALLHKPEIAHCEAFLKFINEPSKSFKKLSPGQLLDYEQRMELEKMRLNTQEEFQTHIASQVYKLSRNFEKFKTELIDNPHQLSAIFVEIGQSSKPEQMSPLVTSFIEWCKLEIAATLYQMFFTQDNSSQLLHKCRKFHRVFPYRMCYGILKYTNPVKIMSRMVDLLLMNMPSFGRKSNQSHNLLSMIFIMLLDDDLQDFSKERQKLLSTKPLNLPEFKVFFDRICAYVNSGDALLEEEIREEHLSNGSSFFLSVLTSDLIQPRLSRADHATFEKYIKPSYQSYQKLSQGEKLDEAAVYVTLKQFWQLEVRTRDKEIFKQLWKEPELTQLIKRVLTVFYQPLMTVMKKCNVHLVFLDFQHFLDDLLAELTVLDGGDMYFTSSVEMFNRFKKLLDKYEGTFYRFLHDLYNKDEGKLFLKLIEWIESFLVALRTKFSEPEKVLLDFAAMAPEEAVDEEKLMSDLNTRIDLILKKRSLLKSCMKNAAANGEKLPNSQAETAETGGDHVAEAVSKSHQSAIDEKWGEINEGMFDMKPVEFGLSGEDFEDFNLVQAGEKAADAFKRGGGNAQVLQEITRLDKLISEISDSEIHKLIKPTQAQINVLIQKLK